MNAIQRFVNTHATGFGGSYFMIAGPLNGQFTTESNMPIKRIPGGNRFIAQFMGRGPETATYDLIFPSVDSFTNFKLLIGTLNTLTVMADTAALADRAPVVIAGIRYDRLVNTVLAGVDPSSVQYQNGGIVRCSATFIRTVSETAITTLWMGAAS